MEKAQHRLDFFDNLRGNQKDCLFFIRRYFLFGMFCRCHSENIRRAWFDQGIMQSMHRAAPYSMGRSEYMWGLDESLQCWSGNKLRQIRYARFLWACLRGSLPTPRECLSPRQTAWSVLLTNAKDEDTARQLRYVANKGRGLDGRHYMQAFDSMADTLDRSLRRTYLIKSWDELTANILENFWLWQ